MDLKFDFIKAPLNRYTFSIKPIREWVEKEVEGLVLNLYAGKVKLKCNEIRVDLDPETKPDYCMDVLQFVKQYKGEKFNTILLDPPYSDRKSMEMYGDRMASPFQRLKEEMPGIIAPNGKIITFGHHSVVLGKSRGFTLEKVAILSHGGAIHDTIVSVERYKL